MWKKGCTQVFPLGRPREVSWGLLKSAPGFGAVFGAVFGEDMGVFAALF